MQVRLGCLVLRNQSEYFGRKVGDILVVRVTSILAVNSRQRCMTSHEIDLFLFGTSSYHVESLRPS